MKRRIIAFLVCLLTMGVFLFAFAGVATAQQSLKGMHIKMLACGDTAVTRLVLKLDEFEKMTGAKVTIDMYPYPGLIDKVVVETNSPTPTYQMFWIDSPWIGLLGEAGSLLDLTALAKRDAKEIKLDDILETQLQENSWQGKLLAIPASGMCWMTVYRKDLFNSGIEKANFKKKYGYELAEPKTWAQYKDIAEFFTRKPGETLVGVPLEQPFYGNALAYSRVQGAITHDYFGIMRSFGGEFWSEDTGFCTLNSEACIKAAEFMYSVIPFNPPDYLALMWDLRTGYMERGEDAISCYWSVRVVRLTNPKEARVAEKGLDAIGYMKNPMAEEGKDYPTYTGSLSFAINSKVSKKEQDAAWQFIKWGTSEELCRKFAEQGMGISQFRKAILNDPQLQKKYPYYKALLEMQKNAKRRIFHPFYADVEEVFGLELNKYMMGETKTAAEALTTATNAINARLAMFPKEMRLRWVIDKKCEVLK